MLTPETLRAGLDQFGVQVAIACFSRRQIWKGTRRIMPLCSRCSSGRSGRRERWWCRRARHAKESRRILSIPHNPSRKSAPFQNISAGRRACSEAIIRLILSRRLEWRRRLPCRDTAQGLPREPMGRWGLRRGQPRGISCTSWTPGGFLSGAMEIHGPLRLRPRAVSPGANPGGPSERPGAL